MRALNSAVSRDRGSACERGPRARIFNWCSERRRSALARNTAAPLPFVELLEELGLLCLGQSCSIDGSADGPAARPFGFARHRSGSDAGPGMME